ncbi:hypothetical protein FRC17_010369 [Serendipita sp. 399]|nr:hypothetical protein FRC17_010369 [Serendipita sp. 399]
MEEDIHQSRPQTPISQLVVDTTHVSDALLGLADGDTDKFPEGLEDLIDELDWDFEFEQYSRRLELVQEIIRRLHKRRCKSATVVLPNEYGTALDIIMLFKGHMPNLRALTLKAFDVYDDWAPEGRFFTHPPVLTHFDVPPFMRMSNISVNFAQLRTLSIYQTPSSEFDDLKILSRCRLLQELSINCIGYPRETLPALDIHLPALISLTLEGSVSILQMIRFHTPNLVNWSVLCSWSERIPDIQAPRIHWKSLYGLDAMIFLKRLFPRLRRTTKLVVDVKQDSNSYKLPVVSAHYGRGWGRPGKPRRLSTSIIAMPALPSLNDVVLDDEGLRAWNLLPSAENAALNDASTSSAKYNDNLVGVRVLGFFLKDFWDHSKSNPYKRLISGINSCYCVENVALKSDADTQTIHAKTFSLSLMYRNSLMRVCEFKMQLYCLDHTEPGIVRSDGGPIPTPSRHSSPPSFKAHKERIISAMFNASKTKNDVKHQRYFASALPILELFGLDPVVEKIIGGQINHLCNRNEYKVCSHENKVFQLRAPPPLSVAFRVDPTLEADCTQRNISLPELPDPTLIAIRAACARVAHVSGALEQFEQILEEAEETLVMAIDGSTADLLISLLHRERVVDVSTSKVLA